MLKMPQSARSKEVAIHKTIVRGFRKLASADGPAVKIRALARRVRKDPRTVRHHLEIMAVHHQVVFLNPEKTVVARLPDLEQLVKSERGRAEREELAYGSAASGAALAWGSEA